MVNKSINFLKQFLYPLLQRVKEHDVSGMAAQLAFFFLLSLFPILLLMTTIVSYLPYNESDIMFLLADYIPEDSMAFLESQLATIMTGSGKLLSVGVLGVLWTSSNAMNGLLKAFNKAYDLEEKRTYIIRRAIALLLTIGMIFIFIMALILPIFGKQIGIFLFGNLGFDDEFLNLWDAIRWGISTLLLYTVFYILYKILPFVAIKRRKVSKGALFATVGWVVVSMGFSFYVNNFSNYSNTYGSIGGIIVLMLWFYLSAHIIVLGSEINALMNADKQ